MDGAASLPCNKNQPPNYEGKKKCGKDCCARSHFQFQQDEAYHDHGWHSGQQRMEKRHGMCGLEKE